VICVSGKLWETIELRNSIMTIAEEIAPIFKSATLEMFGFKARYISVKNVEFESQNLGFCLQYQTEIEFLSDQGSWFKTIMIRYFATEDELEHELKLYNILDLNCLKFPNINPAPLIMVNKTNNYIVMDLLNDKEIEDLNLSESNRDFLLGTLYAIIHGGKSYSLDTYEIIELVKYGIHDLDLDPRKRDKLIEKVDKYKKLVSATVYGYHSSTVVNASIFRFRQIISDENLSEKEITYQTAFEVTILPNQSQEQYSDRMLDVALLFSDEGFQEFKVTNTISKTKARILHFLRAYGLIHKKLSKNQLEKLYPLGFPLDLYIILVLYMSGVKELNETDIENIKNQLKVKLLEFFEFILVNHPFQMYGETEI